MKRMVFWFCFSVLWVLSFAHGVHGQGESFFKGKTVRIVVGFSTGGTRDPWARAIAQHMGKHISGNPNFIVQNMPGGGSIIAANYVYNLPKPDGLTLGLIAPALYFDQLAGRKEVQFDWAKFSWVGSPERINRLLYIRSDAPYRTLEDIGTAGEPPRCGATGFGTAAYYFPKLLEDALGARFNIVAGYPGAQEVNLALERGEVHCWAGTIGGFLGSEPGRTWFKTGFVRVLVQGGLKRDPRLPNIPTIYELMEKHKTPEPVRRLVMVMLSAGDLGLPIVASPGIPVDRFKILRDAFMKTLSNPQLLVEAEKRGWEANPVSGEELESIAKRVIAQPSDVIEQMKRLLGR
jgi:tripartite-type tricarboxylate transporter receptor subunit TctC